MAIVRYFVADVERSISFYTESLGFDVEQRGNKAFAKVSKNDLTLWLSGPQSSAARPMPDGKAPQPGGWNRFVIEVKDLPSQITVLRENGMHFRNEMVIGPGGKQILIDDPDGNPIELFEPATES